MVLVNGYSIVSFHFLKGQSNLLFIVYVGSSRDNYRRTIITTEPSNNKYNSDKD